MVDMGYNKGRSSLMASRKKFWKYAVVIYLKVLSWHSPVETEETYENVTEILIGYLLNPTLQLFHYTKLLSERT
jgi:hypothetical protein